MDALDRQYDEVFEKNILGPIKNAYDLKLYYNKPDSEETMKSIQAASTDKSRLEEMVSNYFANQSMKQKYTDILTDTEYGENAGKSLSDYIDTTSNGMFVLDFSKIENLSAFYKI
jgi:hypothetical protein